LISHTVLTRRGCLAVLALPALARLAAAQDLTPSLTDEGFLTALGEFEAQFRVAEAIFAAGDAKSAFDYLSASPAANYRAVLMDEIDARGLYHFEDAAADAQFTLQKDVPAGQIGGLMSQVYAAVALNGEGTDTADRLASVAALLDLAATAKAGAPEDAWGLVAAARERLIAEVAFADPAAAAASGAALSAFEAGAEPVTGPRVARGGPGTQGLAAAATAIRETAASLPPAANP
jgi:hypothetical protein